jgi:hypothetical protein
MADFFNRIGQKRPLNGVYQNSGIHLLTDLGLGHGNVYEIVGDSGGAGYGFKHSCVLRDMVE